MIPAASAVLRDWLRLLYWTFFKPTDLRAHLRRIAPELPEGPVSFHEIWRAARANADLRRFFLHVLVVSVLTPLVVDAAFGLTVTAVGSDFAWVGSLAGVAGGVALGMAGGVALGMALGVAYGVVVGMALGMAGGVALGMALSVAYGVVVGMALGMARRVATSVALGTAVGVMFGMALGVAYGVVVGMAYSVVLSVVLGVGLGVAQGVVYGVAFGVTMLRIPFYAFEAWSALRAYHCGRHGDDPARYILQSPVYYDDFLVLPQPYLSSLLLLITRADLRVGLQHAARIASNPFQRWAAQRTLRLLLERDGVPFFVLLDFLLSRLEPYLAVGIISIERARAADPYFTAKLLLAELAGVPPMREFSDAFARRCTAWLRLRGRSPYAPLATAYFSLLSGKADPADVLTVFESGCTLAHGEEIYQSFRVADAALRCQSLAHIARWKQEVAPLFALPAPLRPGIVTVFRRLDDAATDALAFLTAVHPVARRDALLKAQGAIEEARRTAETVHEPERRILLQIIEHWRRIFVEEGAQLAEGVEVAVLPNPYVAGRSLRPEDGKLFAGRREVFRRIEETLQTGVTIVLYGQRRIGKTSILLHLHEHLPHSFLPVYCNLQRVQAQTTAGLLSALVEHMTARLHEADWPVPAVPALEAFRAEPFLIFDAFLREVEKKLPPDRRIVLAFDEFEQLEQQVNAGRIDQRIFAFLRGVTQTERGFLFVFAGLHTLEQMHRDYWHPFFLSVKPIKVTYLSEAEAWQLITDPVDAFPLQYDSEAIERIIAVTHGHPYLVQDLCHNLVTHLNDPLHRSNRATVEDVNAVTDRTLESGTYYFADYVWNWSGTDEQLALAVIADAACTAEDSWVRFSLVEKYLGRGTALAVLKNLCARDIVEERAVGETLEYSFQVELSRLWVMRTKPLARIVLEREANMAAGKSLRASTG